MRLWLFCITGFLYDFLQFVITTAVVIRAEDMGASATQLALLQGVSTSLYVVNSLLMGPLADRRSRKVLATIACVGAIAACAMALFAGRLAPLFAAMGAIGIAASIFWPSVQGAIGVETDPARMERALGIFNVLWSLGKSLGFVAVGWMTARWGYAAAAAALPILVLFPRDPAARTAPHAAESHAGRPLFRTIGYMANFAAFGIGSTFANQYIKSAAGAVDLTIADPKTFFGLFLGAIYAAQTAAFAVLQRSSGWTYSRGLLYATQALTAGAAIAITMTRNDGLILGLAVLLGAGLGFAYASSIYYSLHGPADHGKFAGIHEAVLGAGTFLVPLGGGFLADATGNLKTPYWLAAGVVLAAVAAEEILYRRSSRS